MNNVYQHQEQTPIGTITEVHGPVVDIYCKQLPPIRQALSANLNNETCLFEVHQHRIQHLENATHHLDNKTDELKHKINALRQEEIIEEIEVILLNI